MDSIEGKQILISGTNNRYQIKKLKKEEHVVRKKKTQIDVTDFSQQTEILELFLGDKKDSDNRNHDVFNKISTEFQKKLSSYKQQDIKKNRYNVDLFISMDRLISLLVESNLKCYYCSNECLLVYENVRDMSQWTLDRINNDHGHNSGNLVVACLSCNLKRRRTSKDAFLFTKQLNIVREE
jgi:hypothetical protein